MSEIQILPCTQITMRACPYQSTYFLRLIDSIRSAKTSILTCQYVFSVAAARPWQRANKILTEIILAHKRSLAVHVLFDRPKQRSPNVLANHRTAQLLDAAGVPVRCLSVTKTLHIKLIIIDNKILFAGSHNLTNSSLYSPYELTFECMDDFLINSATVYFNCLWNGSMSQPFFEAFRGAFHGDR